MHQELAEFQGALCGVLALLTVVNEVLVRDLVLANLGAGISISASDPVNETNFLVKSVRSPGESVHGVASSALPEVLSNGQVGVNGLLSVDAHRVDVENQQVVTRDGLLVLVDKWQELIPLSVV